LSDYSEQWLSVSPISGTIAPQHSQSVTLQFDVANLKTGIYTTTLPIESNDPDEKLSPLRLLLKVVFPESNLLPSDGTQDDNFGRSISIDSNLALIGAPGDDKNGSASGSAYIYRWHDNQWQEEAILLADDGAEEDNFGLSVSVSADLALIGADGDDDLDDLSGSAYIFRRRQDGQGWQQEAKLLPSHGMRHGRFGSSVSLSGNVAFVATEQDNNSYGSGAAYVYRFDGQRWQQEARLVSDSGQSYDYFGDSVSVSGNVALIGASADSEMDENSGAAYIYRFNGRSWQQEAKLLPSDGGWLHFFGDEVSLSGNLAMVTKGFREVVYLFRWNGKSWQQEARLEPSDGVEEDHFGSSISVHGNLALVGDIKGSYFNPEIGSAYLFGWDGSQWKEEIKLLTSDGTEGDWFGRSVALNDKFAIIGAPTVQAEGSGGAYAYEHPFGNTPELTISPLYLSIIRDEPARITRTLRISNSGSEPLSWQISWDAAWLSADQHSGTIEASDSQSLTLTIDVSTLTMGSLRETLLLTTNDPDEQITSLPVWLSVMAPQSYLPLISR
jgi:hypothetical protein